MKKWSLKSIVIGLGIAVIVPMICFLILRLSGHTGHVAVPKNYGIDSVRTIVADGVTTADTIYHTIGKTNFTSHLNKAVDLSADYPRETLVINFFTTEDTKESNKLTYHMSRIQAGFKSKKHDTSIQLISIAINPAADSLASVRAYANEHSLDHDTWTFVMTDTNELKRFAKGELFLKEEDMLRPNYHTQIVLVDKYRNIRGYYNGLDSMEVKNCIDDIALLMVEKNKIHEKSRR